MSSLYIVLFILYIIYQVYSAFQGEKKEKPQAKRRVPRKATQPPNTVDFDEILRELTKGKSIAPTQKVKPKPVPKPVVQQNRKPNPYETLEQPYNTDYEVLEKPYNTNYEVLEKIPAESSVKRSYEETIKFYEKQRDKKIEKAHQISKNADEHYKRKTKKSNLNLNLNLKGDDLKRAVIYSEILTPKHF